MKRVRTRPIPGRSTFPSADERGSILVTALIILCILSAFCVQLGRNVRGKLDFVRRVDRREELRGATRNGAMDGVSFLQPEGEGAPIGGLATIYCGSDYKINWGYERREESFRVDTAYIDEESKIHLNKADRKVIGRLFEVAAELSEDAATELACYVVDWRDTDYMHQHLQYGAEDEYYKWLDPPYEAKDAPFEVLDELMLVKGITEDVFEKVRNHLTVYGRGKVNVNNASREVLQALGLSESVAGKITAFRLRYDSVERIWKSVRFDAVSSIIPLLKGTFDLTPIEEAELNKVISTNVLVTDSTCYAVRSVGESSNGILVCQVVSVVSVMDGTIMFWREELGAAGSMRLWKARGE